MIASQGADAVKDFNRQLFDALMDILVAILPYAAILAAATVGWKFVCVKIGLGWSRENGFYRYPTGRHG
ncbi:MAG: hypothetical protein LC722_04815 [Actinobacteria bacterium]|nr:hypothetical protein [Actinomycetota bacterium]